MRIAVADRLQAIEPPVVLEALDDRLGHVAHVATGQRLEALDEDARLVERRDDRQPETLAELEVLGAAARCDVDDAGPLLLPDLVPGDDPMHVRARPVLADPGTERIADGGQLVERAGVAPADEVATGPLLEHLEGADDRCLERAAAEPEDIVALPDADVADGLADRRRDVGGQGPGGRRPDEQRLAGSIEERQPDGQAGILAILVALGGLGLADARPAARAPGHRVVALGQPAASVALREEAPDEIVVLVAEGEVRAAQVGHAQSPDDHLDAVRDRPVGSLHGDGGLRVGCQQVAQAAQLVRVVPVHPHAQADGLLGLPRGVGQHALLAQADELGDAEGLDVVLAGEAQVALDIDLDPQPLAVEAVLPALVVPEHGVVALIEVLVGPPPGVMDAHRVVGRDRAVQERPGRAARVLCPQASEGAPLAPLRQDVELLGWEIGQAGDGAEGAVGGHASQG